LRVFDVVGIKLAARKAALEVVVDKAVS